jgi:hypothetical protein
MEAHTREFNFWIGLARVSAVFLAIVVAIEAIRRLFKNSIEHMRVSFWGTGHVFVAGLGRIGMEVARDRVANNDFVIALEIVESNYWTAQAAQDGILVKQGDINTSDLLETIVAKNPREIFLVTGDDQTNINALARVRSLRAKQETERPGSVSPSTCYVHIDDAVLYSTLCRTQADQQKAGVGDKDLAVHFFNINHETACELIVHDLTQLRPTQADQVALYFVFGFEKMGQAMVKELVEFAHFENQRRSRILVLTNDPENDADLCLARWPRMSPRFVHQKLNDVSYSPACDHWNDRSARVATDYQVADEIAVEYAANVHFCRLSSEHVLTQADVAAIVGLTQAEGVCPVALFCHEDDEVNFKLANEFNDLLSDFHGINRVSALSGETSSGDHTIPCRVFLPRSQSLRDMLKDSPEARYLYPFGSVSEGINRAQDALIEDLGMVFGWAYGQHDAATKVIEKKETALNEVDSKHKFDRATYLTTWHQKEYWDRYSNCAAAEHAWIKMQILGLQLHKIAMGDPRSVCAIAHITQEKKSLLAYIEHNRWVSERLLMGWAYGERSDTPPRRPSICPKRVLTASELEKDFVQIRDMCEYLIEKRTQR